MGSLFSKSTNFALPPFTYHDRVYPFPIAKPVDGDYKNGAYRNVESMEQLWTSPIPEKPWVNTSLAVLKHSSVVHGDRDSLGERKKLPDGKLGEYEYVKYKDLYPIVVQLGRSLRKQFPFLQRQGHIGFYGRNCKNIQLYSLAMQSQDQTTVPVYDTLGTNAVKFIVTHCEMSVIAVTEEKLPSLQELLRNSARKKSHIEGETCIRGVVLLNVSPFSPALKAFKEAIPQSIKVIHFEDINCVPYEDPVVQKEDDWVPSGDSILYILYTSGTTGQPKGVMIKHAAMLTISSSFIHNILKNGWIVTNEDGVFSYLPLAHGYECAVEMALLIRGARISYYSGSLKNLVDDLQAAKPTLFIAVPRVLQRIQQTIMNSFASQSWFRRRIIQWCLWHQTRAFRRGHRVALYDRLVFDKVRVIFGGKLRCLASGAAPLSGELSEFLQVCCGVPILEGYGLTETGAACSLTLNNGHTVYYTVGAPLYGHEIRLQSLPEMGYTTDDVPRPRGEILVRGPSMFSGYYKNPELTAAAVDADGWFHTGDIGQFNRDGSLSVIDRKKSMLKLSQGEYVATEAVEAVFSECSWVAQIFVYGNSYENCLVAVASPNPERVIPAIRELGVEVKNIGEEGWKDSLAKACLDPRVVKRVMDELDTYGKRMGLNGFELIKGLYLDGHVGPMNQIFTVDNGMMTPTFKLKRNACQKHYEKEIAAMYDAIHKQNSSVCCNKEYIFCSS